MTDEEWRACHCIECYGTPWYCDACPCHNDPEEDET